MRLMSATSDAAGASRSSRDSTATLQKAPRPHLFLVAASADRRQRLVNELNRGSLNNFETPNESIQLMLGRGNSQNQWPHPIRSHRPDASARDPLLTRRVNATIMYVCLYAPSQRLVESSAELEVIGRIDCAIAIEVQKSFIADGVIERAAESQIVGCVDHGQIITARYSGGTRVSK